MILVDHRWQLSLLTPEKTGKESPDDCSETRSLQSLNELSKRIIQGRLKYGEDTSPAIASSPIMGSFFKLKTLRV